MALGAAVLTACSDDDYKDWVNPQSTTPGAVVTFGDGSVTAVNTIDFRLLDTTYVKVCEITAPTASNESYSPAYSITLSTADNLIEAATFDISEEGYMLASDLQGYLESSYGKRPVERQLEASLSVWEANDAASVKLTSQPFAIKAIPQAPDIETRYYLTGNFNDWNNNDTTYVLTNGGGDVYENSVFSCTFQIPADKVETVTNDGIQFKVTPISGVGGNWSECLCAADAEGKFNYHNVGGNFSFPYDATAKFFKVSFDMLDQTWESKTLSFAEYFYEIGNESGWSTSHTLRVTKDEDGNPTGIYKGYYYLDGEFKFKPNADNWDNDLENNGGYTLDENGAGNCPAPATSGMYEITLDLTTMTYSLTTIEKVGLIGDFNSWGGDVELTYDATSGSYKATGVELAKGGVKFRANADWVINWGGTGTTAGDVTTVEGMTQDGANISLAAGTYDIELTLSYDGNHKAVFTQTAAGAAWSDFIYYAGNSNGWDASANPLALKGVGTYQGFYYIDGEFKIVDGAWYGDGGEGKLSGDGGNIASVAAGFYQMDVDMSAYTYTVTPLTVSIVGSATGDPNWGTDLDMTFNTETKVWEYTGALTTGEFKFRANKDWAISWGGTALDALTSNGGANLNIAADGTYKITFAPNCDDKGVATIEAQ